MRSYHQDGDTRARQRLIELYLPLVESFRRYTRSSDEYDDLYQVGCIGFINAIDRFDLERGDELAAFAVPNIAGEIRRYLRDRVGSVRVPRRVLELRAPASQAQSELRRSLRRQPTTAEIAAELGADEQDVALALEPERVAALELSADAGAEESAGNRSLIPPRIGCSSRKRSGASTSESGGCCTSGTCRTSIRTRSRASSGSPAGRSRATRRTRSRSYAPGSTTAPSAGGPPELPGRHSEPRMEPVASRTSDAPKSSRTHRTPADEPHDQPYHIELVKEEPPGDRWNAQVAELPGCTAQGDTAEEAARLIEGAIRALVADAIAKGREVPKPRSTGTHSGKLLIRMPESLHAELARAAEREEVSLNQFITSSLAVAVGWRRSDQLAAEAPWGATAGPGTRKALLANLVVLAIVAVLALVLLVVALGEL